MVTRRGTTSSGCLLQLLVLAALIYCGVHIGEPYYRYYQYRDSISQQARFAAQRSDDAIRKDLLANADTLALPERAYHFQIKRTEHTIRIWTTYDDSWSIWHYTRPVHFDIDIEKSL